MSNFRLTFHAGHAPSGGLGMGAAYLLNESDEARRVAECLSSILETVDVEHKDVTVNFNTSATKVLAKINKAVNDYSPDLAISIHLNASTGHNAGGCEVFCWNGENGKIAKLAARISAAIANANGIRDRGVKNGNHLSVIKNVAVPSLLIECCFCDYGPDVDRWSPFNTATAIVDVIKDYYGLIPNHKYEGGSFEPEENDNGVLYRVQVGAFANRMNAEDFADLLKSKGFDSFIYESN